MVVSGEWNLSFAADLTSYQKLNCAPRLHVDTEEDGKCNGHATRLYKLPQVETVINDLK
jgi:hypothetical protein